MQSRKRLGTIAVELNYPHNAVVKKCVLRDCEYTMAALDEENGNSVVFDNCIVSGNTYKDKESNNIGNIEIDIPSECDDSNLFRFKNCTFMNNYADKVLEVSTYSVREGWKVSDKDYSSLFASNCRFYDNAWQGAAPKAYGICLNGVTWQVQTKDDGKNVIKIGYPITTSDGTVIQNYGYELLPYSDSSLPWKNYVENAEIDIVDFDALPRYTPTPDPTDEPVSPTTTQVPSDASPSPAVTDEPVIVSPTPTVTPVSATPTTEPSTDTTPMQVTPSPTPLHVDTSLPAQTSAPSVQPATPTPVPSKDIEAKSSGLSKGDTYTVKSGKYSAVYKITGADTATYHKTGINKKASSVIIPSVITINGKKYKITGISANAFKGCTKLRTVTIKSKLMKKSSVKKCFSGLTIKTVKTTKSCKKTYTKIFTKKNTGNKLKIKVK